MAQSSVTSVCLSVDSNEHHIIVPEPHNTIKAEPPLSFSAQESNVPTDPRTSKSDLATEAMNPPSPEWNTQTVLQLEHELLFPSPSPPETSTPEPNVQTDASSTEEWAEVVELTEFTLFPEFPPELRLKVWKEALPGPRIVEIEWCYDADDWFCPIEGQSKPSGLLRANKESREVFLEAYTPVAKFITVNTQNFDSPCNHEFAQYGTAYFNPTADLLYIGPSTCGCLSFSDRSILFLDATPWMKSVTTLACEYLECHDTVYDADVEDFPCWAFPHLKEFIIVVGDVEERDLRPSREHWKNRPRGELEFKDSTESSSLSEIRRFFKNWTENIPEEKIPKLVVKEALRGGVVPRVVTGDRDFDISEDEEESDEQLPV
jgi:hypothetical protein